MTEAELALRLERLFALADQLCKNIDELLERERVLGEQLEVSEARVSALELRLAAAERVAEKAVH